MAIPGIILLRLRLPIPLRRHPRTLRPELSHLGLHGLLAIDKKHLESPHLVVEEAVL
jgi:hypothetical protein